MRARIITVFFFSIILSSGLRSQWYPQYIETEKDLNSLSFLDTIYGWAAGDEGIFRTVDGGHYWHLAYYNPFTTNINFVSPDLGWAIASDDAIRTQDGGYTWLDATPPCIFDGCYAVDISFADEYNGWYLVAEFFGSRDIWFVCHTLDGGSTWDYQVELGCCFNAGSVYFIDRKLGWTIFDGYLSVTFNGGEFWDTTWSYLDRSIMNAYFADSMNGWAIGTDSSIIHTRDGGHSWHEQYLSSESLYDIHFTDTLNGWVVGDNGIILHSNDGGLSWIFQNSGTDVELYDVYFTDPDHGWIAGDDGTILHTENGGLVSIDNHQASHDFRVFPNPARHEINIFGETDPASFVSIYDITGKMVMQSSQPAHAINISNLPSGIYIVEGFVRKTPVRYRLVVER